MGEIQKRHFLIKNGKKFAVRTATPEDSDSVVSYIKTVISEAPYLLTTKAEFKVTVEQQEHLFQQLVADIGKITLLAEYGGEIIGYLDFHNGSKQRNKHQGYFGMTVRKDFRNQGVGKALVSVLLEWGKTNPLIEKVCLEVFANNVNAIGLYKKLGFFEEGVKRGAIKIDAQTYYDLILMATFVKE